MSRERDPARPSRAAILASLWLTALTSVAVAEAAVWRVDADDPDAENSALCGPVERPCLDIQQAVNNAVSGDTVLVATGTYTYDSALEPPDCLVSTGVVCIIGKELTLLGGYAGGDWENPDPAANPTVIDGADARRGLIVKRKTLTSPAASLVMEGFTITRGLADSSPADGDDAFGGGLAGVLADLVVLRDMVFDRNVARGKDTASAGGRGGGGGAAIRGADSLPTSAVLERVVFDGNLAVGGEGDVRGGIGTGGGLLSNKGTSFAGSDLVFTDNTARGTDSTGVGILGLHRADSLGGGLALLSIATTALERITATGNSAAAGDATGTGGLGGAAFGGAVYLEGTSASIAGAELRSNSAVGGDAPNGGPGGGSQAKGGLAAGGALMTFDAPPALERVLLIDNLARGGEGPANGDHGDRGNSGGGGAYLEQAETGGARPAATGPFSIADSLFADNAVELADVGDLASGGGGGLFLNGASGAVTQTTFAGNRLDDPTRLTGQALVAATRLGEPADVAFDFAIVADHQSQTSPAVTALAGSSVDFLSRRTLFANNAVDSGGAGEIVGVENLLSAPSADFVAPGAPDFDYHLLPSSPAVDEATGSAAAIDFDGQTRESRRDLGADELCTALDDELELSGTETGSVTETACDRITAASYVVAETAAVTLQTGIRIVLGEGFRTESGGSLTAVVVVP